MTLVDKNHIVGITGGIGSGKSLISELFNSLGIPIYNSDKEAKNLYYLKHVREAVIKLLGLESYIGDELNSKYIGKIVFSNKATLQKLNQIIHPEVKLHFKEWVKIQRKPLVVKEAAILIESGAYKDCHSIVTVSCPEDIRINRVIERDNVNRSAVKSRMEKQLKDSERNKYADYVILNDGSTSVIRQVYDIYKTLSI